MALCGRAWDSESGRGQPAFDPGLVWLVSEAADQRGAERISWTTGQEAAVWGKTTPAGSAGDRHGAPSASEDLGADESGLLPAPGLQQAYVSPPRRTSRASCARCHLCLHQERCLILQVGEGALLSQGRGGGRERAAVPASASLSVPLFATVAMGTVICPS